MEIGKDKQGGKVGGENGKRVRGKKRRERGRGRGREMVQCPYLLVTP